MSTPHDNLWDAAERDHLVRVAQQMRAFRESEAYEVATTLVRARIYEEWTRSSSTAERERLSAEQRAVERVLDAFQEVYESGLVAEEARRREIEAEDRPGVTG